MRYGLQDRPVLGITLLAALQWLFVTLSSTIVVPLVIGDVYGLDASETAKLMQQTIFYAGLASLLQVLWGHRYPMMDGPAGLWWGIFVILAQIGQSIGQDARMIGQSFQTGLMLAGLLFFILGMFRLIERIQLWFTPIVTGTYMTLLAVSLCSAFIKGMLGIGFQQSETVQPEVAIASVLIMILVLVFTRIRQVASFAVLLGIIVGWVGYGMLGWAEPVRASDEAIVLPGLLFWGPPAWNGGVLLTSLLTSFVLLTNLITSIAVVGKAAKEEPTGRQYNRGGVFTGVSHVISGASGVVGMIPLSLAAAVIETTKMAARRPFILAMLAMMAIGILPSVSQFLASVPSPVAYAAMFVTYTQLLGFGLKDFTKVEMDERNITVIGSSLLIGIGVMFVPSAAWQGLHPLLSYLLGNGLLLGVLVSLLLEHIILPRRSKRKDGPGRNKLEAS
ncbi:purine/pyrimidine permease [Brevibacillus humidisoli]|uniref:purine/pyrimidine permease n=1 Tax=Brevibacillus humidisoli TaxID=2895522 RepID=UPI001E2F7270|nr:purine/pyrimidine permease [Brevibacillus humidisoli]UFJ41303.1 purine/pyrimidine permease [Brevibacillus humidisoli]